MNLRAAIVSQRNNPLNRLIKPNIFMPRIHRSITTQPIIDNSILKYVPLEQIDEQMCLIAINSDATAIEQVPEYLINEKMWIRAVANGYPFDKVPENQRTQTVCQAAVFWDPHIFSHM